jgi:hypothetical protein
MLTSRERGKKRGKICPNKSHETKSHTASKRRLQSSAQVDSKVNRPKETECIIRGKSFDKDWIQCKFYNKELMKTAQTQKETFFFINVIFAELKLTFICFAILKNIVSVTTRHISSCCENRLLFALLFPYHKIKLWCSTYVYK